MVIRKYVFGASKSAGFFKLFDSVTLELSRVPSLGPFGLFDPVTIRPFKIIDLET